jgi:hypothetical protein
MSNPATEPQPVTELQDDTEDRFFARRWTQLEHLDQLGDHWWWRPGWRVGRSFFTWHVTFETDPGVAEFVRRWQDGLDLPGLDVIPGDGLHLTMQGVGFTDEIDPAEIPRIVDAATARCATLRPFTLILGPADADPEGVSLAVRPWLPIRHLRHTIRAAIADVRGMDDVPEPADGFWPHVSVAYSSGGAPAPLVRDRIVVLRQTIAPIEITVAAASLIRLNRDAKEYRWTTEATVPLAATDPSGSAAVSPGPSTS